MSENIQRNSIWLIVFLGIISAMAPLSTDMYLPGLPMVQQDFGINTSLAQLTLTMTLVGMAVGQVFLGPISDLKGRKPPILLGMIVFAVANFACATLENIWAFLLFRFLGGFAGASGIVISKAIARDRCQGVELTKFFGVLMMVHGLAPVVAPVFGGQLMLFTDWRGIFLVLTAIGVSLTVAAMLFKESLPEERRIKYFRITLLVYPHLLKDRYFVGHCLVQCFVSMSFFSYISGSAFLFQNIYGVSPQVYSLIFGAIGIGLMLVGLLPARLAGRVKDVIMLQYAITVPFIFGLLLLGGFIVHAPIWFTLPVLLITIIPLSVMGASSFSLALSRQGKYAGSAAALIGFFSMILGGLMMPLTGIAGDHNALPMGIIMVCGYVAALICFYWIIAPEHREELAKQ